MMLPVLVTTPAVLMLPPITLPAELIAVETKTLPPLMFPSEVVMFPMTDILPPTVKSPPFVVTIAPPMVRALAT